MLKEQYFRIYISILILWLFSITSSSINSYLTYIFILSIGIIHGTNDLEILLEIKTKKFNYLKTLGQYLLLIVLASALFILSKELAFLLFLLFSCHHFGEQNFHTINVDSETKSVLLYFTYGTFVFSILFLNNFQETLVIMQEMFAIKLSKTYLIYIAACSFVIFICILLQYAAAKKKYTILAEEVLYLFVLFVIFRASDLIISFGIYFIVWHSIPSIIDQLEFMYGKASRQNFIKYLKKSILFWGIGLLTIGILFWYYRDSILLESILFGVLFVISLPHVIVITLMNKFKKV
ncbi:Brp/Blh family beta-carotene 15,15'-dioxygenase [Tenacibaculum sp. SG-28]|uniref:Brp/Blh family beta-carotene 15,15'-dioxygenase n=1 Tax=Tenacibaculum sp. SG-28 TaxID=754426 RepID=UPI000CF47C3C|nr:Brp/Blh family beta-carotene 15,15'-dioxygenase [Tenacibaculum sp. SG-28]PQJ23083.1 hypothetical protein BSU00_02150 [Tenacibaculum sp. SG-28]